ncbi:fibronectin type III domain-containing protein [Streptomyces sp. XM4193]|uniref:fibronectin type III domain-containing protein n=1 Tax=Streptomyces sp. XM4193 TaxID=2929782 RepID=UPI001FF90FC1|nr:fibronectin type III domain-containing protein [Streptomyces sp. XM4193]MCK1796942.1 fibronectin type III domain-containing protein [Streptomyces sp. XM4193]
MARRSPMTHSVRAARTAVALAAAALLASVAPAPAQAAPPLPDSPRTAAPSPVDRAAIPARPAAPGLAAPAELRVEATGPTTARLSWQPPRDHDGVNGYVVFQQGTSTPIAEVEADTLSTDVGSLEPGISYTFTVHSVDEKGRVSPAPRRVELVMPPRADVEPPDTTDAQRPSPEPDQD